MVTLSAASAAAFRAIVRAGAFPVVMLVSADPALAATYPQPPDPFGFDKRPSIYLERGGEKICVVELRGDLAMGSGAKGSLPDCGQEHAYLCPMPGPSACERQEPADVPELLAWAFGSPAEGMVAHALDTAARSATGLGLASGGIASSLRSTGAGNGAIAVLPPSTEVCFWERECSTRPSDDEPEAPPLAPVPLPAGLPLILTTLLAFCFLRRVSPVTP